MQNRPFTGLRHPYRDRGHSRLFSPAPVSQGLWRLHSRLSISRHCHCRPFDRELVSFVPGEQSLLNARFRGRVLASSLLNACPGAQASNAQASSGAPSLQGTSPIGARRELHGGVADCRVHRRPPSEQRNEVPTGKRGNVSFLISARALCQSFGYRSWSRSFGSSWSVNRMNEIALNNHHANDPRHSNRQVS